MPSVYPPQLTFGNVHAFVQRATTQTKPPQLPRISRQANDRTE